MSWGAALGSAISTLGNMWSTSKTNKTNKSIANSNNAAMMELANTAHQREVKDLQEAGLNPILSAGGTGAETPNLQQPDLKAPQFDTYAVTDAIRALSEAKLNNSQTEKNQSENLLVQQQTIEKDITNKINQINLEIKKGTKQAEIQKQFQELDNMFWNMKELQENAAQTRINSMNALTEYNRQEKVTKQLEQQIKNMAEEHGLIREQKKYTHRRASGKGANGGLRIGLDGISLNGGGNW